MVIRRQRDWDEEDDVWIVIARDQGRTVAKAMEKVLAELEADTDGLIDDGNPPSRV